MRCLDEEQLIAIGSKRTPMAPAVVSHLGGCPDCRRLVALAVRATSSSSRRAPHAGELLGDRYVLERRIGSGAMGEVWEARAKQDAVVALKLSRNAQAPLLVQRAFREARLAGSLDHPNVVRVLEVIDCPERGPVLVMELLVGETLQDLLLRDRRLPLERACTIALQIAEALVYSHGRGIIHRDLKPSNVMLVGDAGSGVKLLDFGLARPNVWSPSEPRLTSTGDVLGTVTTMAPEQVLGASHVDGRVDVWALGVVVYRMLVGSYPIEATTPGEVIKWLRDGKVRPIEACVEGLPLELSALVMQALELDRDQRLTSPALFLPTLRRYAAGRRS